MSNSLQAKLRIAALGYPALATALGYDGTHAGTLRMYDTQLKQGTAFPALVTTLVSDPQSYTFEHRLATSFSRIQFEIWDYDPEDASAILSNLMAFLDQFNAYGVSGLAQNACQIVNVVKRLWADTQPPQFQLIADARIFNNGSIN